MCQEVLNKWKRVFGILFFGVMFIDILLSSFIIDISPVYADTTSLGITSVFLNDASNSTALSAVTADGGTSTSFTKNNHFDMSFDTLSVGSITSATLYYDASGTLSGSWGVYVQDSRDGTTLCSADPAPENSSETRNSLSCTITVSQLSSGVWLYMTNDDTAGPESITLDYIYLSVEYTPAISISLSTNGSVAFGHQAVNTTVDTTSSGLDDVETISVDSGPADLDVRASSFTNGSNTWTFGSSNGSDQVKFEFSKDGTNWSTFLVADTLYALDTNVAESSTRSLYLKLTTPSSTSYYNQFSTTVTIVASSP